MRTYPLSSIISSITKSSITSLTSLIILNNLTVFVATQTVYAQKSEQDPPPSPTPAIGYTVTGDPITFPIRAFDTIRIQVFNGREFSGDYTVQKDGTITLPKLGLLPLSGMNQAQAEAKLRQRLIERKQLVNPNVVVTMVARKAREVIISGEVKTRGRIPLRENPHLSDVVDRADPTDNADLTRVSLKDKTGVERGPINYQRFLAGLEGTEQTNPKLREGDIILVPPQILQEGRYKITGEIKDPKAFYIVTKGLTAAQAVQTAGGLADLADKEKIVVRRNAATLPVPYRDITEKGMVDKDITLKNGDEIFIPKRERPLSYSVTGAIQASTTLFPLRDKTTARAAVLEARPAEGAKLDKVKLIRPGESDMILNIKKGQGDDIFLQDGDILDVPAPSRRQQTDIINTLSQTLGLYYVIYQIRKK